MNRVPNLFGQVRRDGSIAWHWKPSPRLRRLGWTNKYLGDDEVAARAAAVARNAVVKASATPAELRRRIARLQQHRARVDQMLDKLNARDDAESRTATLFASHGAPGEQG